MPHVVRQNDTPRSEDTLAAQLWAERCAVRRLATNILMMLLVWAIVAAAAFALMSR